MRKCAHYFLLVLLLAVSATTRADTPDVIGIRIGMQDRQALDIFKKENCPLRNTNAVKFQSMPNQPITFGYACVAAGYSQTIAVGVSGAPAPSQVFAVTRHVAEPENSPIALSGLLDSLRKKYGKETYLNPNGSEAVWFFDQTGNAASIPAIDNYGTYSNVSDCRGFDEDVLATYQPYQYRPDKKSLDQITSLIGAGGKLNPKCGVVVVARWGTAFKNKKLVTGFTVSLTDHVAWMASVKGLYGVLEKADAAFRANQSQRAESRGGPQL